MPSLADWTHEAVPDMPGAVRFTPPGQKPILMVGQPALAMADRIEQTRRNIAAAQGVAPQPMANNWAGGLNNWATDAGGAPSGQQSSEEIERKGQEAMQRFGGAFNAGPTQPASAQTSEQPRGEITQKLPPLQQRLVRTPLGYLEDPVTGTRYTTTGGRASITQTDREAMAKTGTPTPTAQTTTTEGGFDPDMDFLEREREIALDRADLATDNQIRMLDIAAKQHRLNQSLQAQKAAEIKQEQDKAIEIEKRVDADRAFMEKTRADFASKKVDPNRIYRGDEGTVRGIVHALAAGLGAFGATLGRTDNFAMNQINAMIDRDIGAQEAEIKTLGVTADNALARLNQTTGDLNQSKMLLKSIALEQAALQSKELADMFGTEQALAASQQQIADFEQNANRFREEYLRLSRGKNTKHVQEQILYPQKGVAPGIRPLTIQENINIDKHESGMATEAAGRAATGATIGKTIAEGEKAAAEAERKKSGEELTPEQIDYNKRVQSVDAAKGQIEALAARYGYEVDRATGKLTLKKEGDGFPRNWAGLLPTETLEETAKTAESKKLERDLTALGVAFGRVINDGGEPSADLARRMIPQWDSTTAPNDLAAQLESNYQNLLQREGSIKAGSTAGARAGREVQREQTAAERATKPTVDLKPE